MARRNDVLRGPGVPWVASIGTAFACVIAILQWHWGGFDYIPTLAKMGAIEVMAVPLTAGWLSGSSWQAVFGILGFGLALGQMERRVGCSRAAFFTVAPMILAAALWPLNEGWFGPASVASVWVGTYVSGRLIREPRPTWREARGPVLCGHAVVGAMASPGASVVGLGILVLYGLALGWLGRRSASAASMRWRRLLLDVLTVSFAIATVVAFASTWARYQPWRLVKPVALEPRAFAVDVGDLPGDNGRPRLLVGVDLPAEFTEPSRYGHRLEFGADGSASFRVRADEVDVLFGIESYGMMSDSPPRDTPIWVHVWAAAELECEVIEPRFDAQQTRTSADGIDYVSEEGISVRTRTISAPLGCAHLAVYAWEPAPAAQRDAVTRILESFRFERG